MNQRPIEILLVEDNPDHVELILKVLLDNDVLNAVHVVTDGEKALDFLYRRGEHVDAPRPGLILLDIKLPKVNGIEVLKQIKADPTLKSIPVVMLTTSEDKKGVAESYSYGANSYIIKPVDFNQFARVLKDIKFYWLITSTLDT